MTEARKRSTANWLGGIGLFLFIPITLILFLYLPLGLYPSFVLALLFMFGHRFVAMPWVAARRPERCLWSGASRGCELTPTPVRVGADVQGYHACRQHADKVRRFANLATTWRIPIAIGIFIPLFTYILLMLISPMLPDWVPSALKHLFRGGIGLTCLVISFAWRALPPVQEEMKFPFPLHNLALLGIRNTLWIFRTVGAVWVAMTLWAVATALR